MPMRGPRFRTACLAGLAVLLLTTSGCVYWRLSRFRGQLGQFARYFSVEADPGPTITFLKPVLREGDIAWLLDVPPGEISSDGPTTERSWVLRKRSPVEPESDALERIPIRVTVVDSLIHSVRLPERFNEVINQDVLEQSFADSSQEPVDREMYRTGWALTNDLDIPNEEELRAALGAPVELQDTGVHRVLDYAFDVVRDGLEPGEGPADATARFLFDRTHGNMVRVDARFGIFSVRISSDVNHNYRITLQRGASS